MFGKSYPGLFMDSSIAKPNWRPICPAKVAPQPYLELRLHVARLLERSPDDRHDEEPMNHPG